MCAPTAPVREWLDETPEEDRRSTTPVPPQRTQAAIKTLGKLLGLMSDADIITGMAEIGLLECVDFNESGKLYFNVTDAMAIAAAAALWSMHEEAQQNPMSFVEVIH